MAAADKVKIYNSFLKNEANDLIALSTNDIKVALVSSDSNAELLTLEFFTQITNELPTANGYTAGGQTLTNVVIAEAAGITSLDAENVVWTAINNTLSARLAVIYADTPVGKPLIGFILLDSEPADLAALVTQQFIIQWHVNGVIRFVADNV
jgi:hypothetical protein